MTDKVTVAERKLSGLCTTCGKERLDMSANPLAPFTILGAIHNTEVENGTRTICYACWESTSHQ